MGKLYPIACGVAFAALTFSTPVRAEHDCEFRQWGSTLILRGDCTTDATVVIPDGMTLDGRGHTIAAVDPPDGAFAGAVVQNGGSVAHVRRLTVDTQGLGDTCQGGAEAGLRGILFVGASGSVQRSQVLNIDRPRSVCQGGHAIEIRGGDEGTVEVSIVGNHIEGYQKTGVLAVGDVEVSVSLNRVVGLGATERIAQNGIQLTSGATGSLTLNQVEGNLYTPGTFTSTGILLLSAGEGVEVKLNRIDVNDVGIFLSATSGASVSANQIRSATYDAISVDGRGGPAEDNRIVGNDVRGGGNGIGLFGAGASGNLVAHNRVNGCAGAGVFTLLDADANQVKRNLVRRCVEGIVVESDDNEITGNHVLHSEQEGIVVTGVGNVVGRNLVL